MKQYLPITKLTEVNNTMHALRKKIRFEIPLRLKSGLHIGGSNLSMAIGGADAVVIRDPITQEPIIPGSSVKGKMRSMTEKLLGALERTKMGTKDWVGPYQSLDDKVKKIIPELYGRALGNDENIPSRLIVRDSRMSKDSEEKLRKSNSTDMLYTEVKTEVVIDRVTSAANPRQLERVPAGSVFHLVMILNVFDNDDEKKLIEYVKVGLHLMEDDYLGGKGSRGSGEIELDWEKLNTAQKTMKDYEEDNEWQPHKESS